MDWKDLDFNLATLRVIDLKRILSSYGISLPHNAKKVDFVNLVQQLRSQLYNQDSDEGSESLDGKESNSDTDLRYYSSSPSNSTSSPLTNSMNKEDLSDNASSPVANVRKNYDRDSNIFQKQRSSSPPDHQFTYSRRRTIANDTEPVSIKKPVHRMSMGPIEHETPRRSVTRNRKSFPFGGRYMDTSMIRTSPAFQGKVQSPTSSPLLSGSTNVKRNASEASYPVQFRREDGEEKEAITEEESGDDDDDELFKTFIRESATRDNTQKEKNVRKSDSPKGFLKRAELSLRTRSVTIYHFAVAGLKGIVYLFRKFWRITAYNTVTLSLLLVLVFVLGLWHEEVYRTGFCNVPSEAPTILRSLGIGPMCIPCPPNALCFSRLEVECKPGYILSEPWYSRLHIWPSKQCLNDSVREQNIKVFYEECLNTLRKLNARLLTKKISAETIAKNKTAVLPADIVVPSVVTAKPPSCKTAFSVAFLYDLLLSRKVPSLPVSEFNDLFAASLPLLLQTDEISMNGKLIESSSWVAIPWFTRVRRQLFLSALTYKTYILAALTIASLALLIVHKVQQTLFLRRESERIATFCLQALKQHKARYQASKVQQSAIPLMELRDIVFHAGGPMSKKRVSKHLENRLWSLVVNKLGSMATIRTREAEVEGEWTRVWEWVGVNTLNETQVN